MPDLNTLPVVPNARQPRGAVKLNGEVIPGWVSWEVDNNAYRSADTFRVVFVVSMLPATRDAAWFAAQSSMMVEIFAKDDYTGAGAYVPAPADSLLYGQTDEVLFDPVKGTIELSGRDLTALLIDTKNAHEFVNTSGSGIVKYIGLKHGLDISNVHETQTGFFGDYYKDERGIYKTNEQSDWETLSYIANVEDFVLYVKGQELHFEPRPGEQTNHYAIAWDAPNADRAFPIANAVSLQFSRNLTIAKGVTVEVHSWNAKQKKGFSASWPKAAKAVQPGQSAAKTQVYRYNIAGLTQDKALQRAQSIYKQIIAHEMRLTAYLPADNVLDCTKTMMVRGTGTGFDQVYYPESVMRSMSLTEGYRMNIRAKNTSPELEVTQ
jgi:phage protein D